MIKKLIIVVIVICLTANLTSCKKNVIKIGFVGGLTGNNSELAKSGMYGAMLAIDHINKSGGIAGQQLKLVIKDDKSDKFAALEADKQLKDEGCVAIIGHFISSMAELSVPFANDNDILMLSPTITTNKLSDIDDNFLRLAPSVKLQSDSLFKQITHDNKTNIVIFYDDDNRDYAGELAMFITANFDENSLIKYKLIPFSKLNPIDTIANSNLLKNGKFDATLIIASADVTALFCQFLFQQKIIIDKYCSTWAMTNDLISHGGKAVEGMTGVNFFNYALNNPSYELFKNKYIDKYKEDPDFSAMYSYESIKVLEYALNMSKSVTTSDIKQSIINKSIFNGVQSTLSLDKYGDCVRDTFICKIINSKFVTQYE